MQKSNWKEFIFKDLGQIITGKTPSTKEKGVFGCDIPFLTPTDITNQRYISTTNRFLSKTGNFSVKKFLLPKNSISVTCIGSDMGKVVINARELITNQQINSIIINSSIVDYLYLYYALKKRKKELLNLGLSGSTMPILNKTAFSNLKISLPPLDEQKRIAGVLGAFDDKIELLQKQNTTLENMAKALFKSWFVDFDVVHAKQQGQPKAAIMQQYHLTEELYNLFPSSFEPSALGPIPTGWQVKKIQDLAKVVGGGTPSTKEPAFFAPKGTAIAWLTPKDLSGYAYKYISCGQTDITNKGLDNSSAQLMPKNTIVFSSRAPIGYIAVSLGNITTNQGFKSLIPSKTYYTEFLYHFLCYNKQKIEGLGTGSTFKEISGSVMKSISLYVPNEKILEKFEDQSVIINEKLKNNQKQIQTLTEMRDGLLPRLISGKIRV